MQEQDYNNTLNLPSTEFPMRAGLPQREPAMLEEWEKKRLYDRLMEKNEGKPVWVLHDGPPYANGDIHIGTAMNKIIKDIIVRYRNMVGYSAVCSRMDTHGLPIELKARQGRRGRRFRCRPPSFALSPQFALGYVDDQREQFKRLESSANGIIRILRSAPSLRRARSSVRRNG